MHQRIPEAPVTPPQSEWIHSKWLEFHPGATFPRRGRELPMTNCRVGVVQMPEELVGSRSSSNSTSMPESRTRAGVNSSYETWRIPWDARSSRQTSPRRPTWSTATQAISHPRPAATAAHPDHPLFETIPTRRGPDGGARTPRMTPSREYRSLRARGDRSSPELVTLGVIRRRLAPARAWPVDPPVVGSGDRRDDLALFALFRDLGAGESRSNTPAGSLSGSRSAEIGVGRFRGSRLLPRPTRQGMTAPAPAAPPAPRPPAFPRAPFNLLTEAVTVETAFSTRLTFSANAAWVVKVTRLRSR